jgi:hypothetical protein
VRRHPQHRAEVRGAIAAPLVGGIKAVAKEVEQDAGYLLRRQLDRGDGRIEITFHDFPHQSTAEQWFDEPQLESYRVLGYLMTKRILLTIDTQLSIEYHHPEIA